MLSFSGAEADSEHKYLRSATMNGSSYILCCHESLVLEGSVTILSRDA